MESYELVIPKTLYPSSVLMRTAYIFIDRVYIHFSASDEDWIVELSRKNSDCSIEIIAKEFENNLISQTLRKIISEKTKTLREIILARSLTSTYIDEEDLSYIVHLGICIERCRFFLLSGLQKVFTQILLSNDEQHVKIL